MSMTQTTFPPIPEADLTTDAGSYGRVPFDFDDPRGREPLVDLALYGLAVAPYARRASLGTETGRVPIAGATTRVWARKSVAEKLAEADRFLSTTGTALFVQEAYRPLAQQQAFWDFFLARTRATNPTLSAEACAALTVQLVSDPRAFSPTDPATWPLHTTGGAVDVVLIDKATGRFCDMGSPDGPSSDLNVTDALERLAQAQSEAPLSPALINRRLLYAAMTQAGFINYPREFWHYDYGDQMYVLHAQMHNRQDAPRAAWYGYVPVPAEDGPALTETNR